MKIYPFEDCSRQALQLVIDTGALVYEQWLCEHCGAKQTMEPPNTFFEQGRCQECGKMTDIKKNGCNYMVVYGGPVPSQQEWLALLRKSMVEAGLDPSKVDEEIGKMRNAGH